LTRNKKVSKSSKEKNQSVKCSFIITDEESLKETLQWLHSVGIHWLKTPQDLHKFGSFDIELKDTPSILEIFSQLEVLSIPKITSQGISFYITDVPLGSSKAILEGTVSAITSTSPEGIVFCPMSNVKSINTFGTLQINKQNPN
jgi:hypothetical protein